ncbi:MAG: FtsH protease activity modulator HflK [Gammaproteobacteria bacterium]|nr:FtsH protease activity modulator HflK [Gammaproteobacteria bacterium]
MAWNEPPDNKGQDPWGNRGRGEGPPDLDDIVRKMQEGFGGLFGGKPSKQKKERKGFPFSWMIVVIVLVLLLLVDITYLIDQQERGVVLRFGRYDQTLQPGLNFVMPSLIDRVVTVNVGQVRSITHKASMLTQDENIVDVEVAVQWRIVDPADFIFNVKDPALTLRQVTESAVRAIIGQSELDYVLTEGRSEIAQQQQELMQKILIDDYKSGILIVTVEMQPAKPPEDVKAAFDDAIKAREDEQRLVNEAEAYRNDILPRARGAAARVREEANGYKASVIAKSEGDAARFNQLLAEYERAPEITRKRLYLESIESVMSGTNKVLLDAEGGNSLMYLPLDKLIQPRGTSSLSLSREGSSDGSGSTSGSDIAERAANRARGVR